MRYELRPGPAAYESSGGCADRTLVQYHPVKADTGIKVAMQSAGTYGNPPSFIDLTRTAH